MPAEEAAVPSGEPVGRYLKTQRLGAGGMGEVWKAFDPELRRWVALKFLKGDDPADIARFRQEAQTAAQLSHPNIAAIHEVGEAGGRPFIAMQFVDGRPLHAYARREPRLAVALVRDAARAIDHAHRCGIIHRDIKPANVMVEAAGHGSEPRVYVMDFGLAKRTATPASLTISGALLGTPAYMSPEQARGDTRTVGPRSDIYALGATLYELLCGEPPFTGESLLDVLQRVVAEPPPALRTRGAPVDRDLEAVVARCLEKNPADRYLTARDLADDLARWLKGEPVRAHVPGAGARLVRLARNHAGTLALTAAALGLGVTITIAARGRPARPAAPPSTDKPRPPVTLVFGTEDGNAADLYRALAGRLPPMRTEIDTYRQGVDADRAAAADCIAAWESVLADYERASRMRTCNWTYPEGLDRETLLPQASSVMQASKVLCARARMHASEQRLHEAARDVVTALKLGHDLLQDRPIVSHLCGIVCLQLGFASFRDALVMHAPPAQLEFIEAHARALVESYPAARSLLDGEKQQLAEGLALDSVELARQFPSLARHRAALEQLAPFVQKNRTLARRTVRARIEERYEQLAAELSQEPLLATDRAVDLAEIARNAAIALRDRSGHDPEADLRHVADLMVVDAAPKAAMVRAKWAYGHLALELLALASALRCRRLEAGSYPEQLVGADASVTDPWDGRPVKYERRGDAFVLTTAGPAGNWRERNRILADECGFDARRFRERSEEIAGLLPVTFWCAPR